MPSYGQSPKKRQYEIRDLDTALERIRQLEDALGLTFSISPEFGLTRTEEMLLGMLYSRSYTVTRLAMFDVVYGMHDNPPEQKILDVLMSHLRKKLAPIGLTITTVWGRGWYLEPAERNKLEPIIMRSEREAA